MTVTINLAHTDPKITADSLLFQFYVVDECTEGKRISKLDTAELVYHLE